MSDLEHRSFSELALLCSGSMLRDMILNATKQASKRGYDGSANGIECKGKKDKGRMGTSEYVLI